MQHRRHFLHTAASAAALAALAPLRAFAQGVDQVKIYYGFQCGTCKLLIVPQTLVQHCVMQDMRFILMVSSPKLMPFITKQSCIKMVKHQHVLMKKLQVY